MGDICEACLNNKVEIVSHLNSRIDADDSQLIISKCFKCSSHYINSLTVPLEKSQAFEGYEDDGNYTSTAPILNSVGEWWTVFCARSHVRLLQRAGVIFTGQKLLEIGAGKGRFLEAAKRGAAKVYGIEPTLRSYATAKKRLGPCIENKSYEELDTDEKMDIIVLNHVFEHLTDTNMFISWAKQKLLTTGTLVITIPNIEGIIATEDLLQWYQLDPDYHRNFISENGMKAIAKRHGLKLSKRCCGYLEIDYLSYIQSGLNKSGYPVNLLMKSLKRDQKAISHLKNNKAEVVKMATKSVYYALASLLRTRKINSEGRGDSVTYILTLD